MAIRGLVENEEILGNNVRPQIDVLAGVFLQLGLYLETNILPIQPESKVRLIELTREIADVTCERMLLKRRAYLLLSGTRGVSVDVPIRWLAGTRHSGVRLRLEALRCAGSGG